MKRETFFVVALIAACSSLFSWYALAQQNQTEATPKAPPVSGGARIIFLDRDDTDIIPPAIKPLPAALFLSNWTSIPVCTALKTQTETSITISPSDPLNLVGVWIDCRRSTDQLIRNGGYGYTVNGGLSWQTGLITAPYDNQFDPSIAVDKNGNFYYCFDAQNSGAWYDQPGGIFVAKSNAASKGATWGTPVAVVEHPTYPSPQFEDKPYIAVDATNSAYSGNIYVAWTRFSNAVNLDTSRILFTKSTNGGASFSQSYSELEKVIRYDDEVPGPGDVVLGAMPAIGCNGEVYVTWLKYDAKDMHNPDKNFIRFKKSTNGGTSFGILKSVAGIKAVKWIKGNLEAPSFPSMAIDRNNGYIYIVWSAKSTGGDLDIYLSKSTNGGTSWSASPIRVNQDPIGNGKDQFLPWISVDPTGRIAIIYYDQRNYASSDPWVDLYLAESLNYGTSFSEYQINDAAINVEDYWFPPDKFIGDYLGMASDVGYVYPLWTDTRNASEDIYTARVNRPPTSNSANATAGNGQRKLARQNNGTYHLVFETNQEIWYARKTTTDTEWNNYQRLSNGDGNNNYPSISEKSGLVYVAWQRKTGTSSYDIHYAASMNSGASWPKKYVLNSTALSENPLPVTQTTVGNDNSIMVVFRYGTGSAQGLKSYWSYYSDPSVGDWSTRIITAPSPASALNSPSLTGAPPSDIFTIMCLAYANSSTKHVYYSYYDPDVANWSTPANLSAIVPGSNYLHETPSISAVPNSGQLHLAWHRKYGSGSSPYDHVIIHRKSTNYDVWPNVYSQTYYESQEFPSISALSSTKAYLLFQLINNQRLVYKMQWNGSYWGAPVSVTGNGQYPSVSSGSTSAKYVWTEGFNSPYEVKLSAETLQKSADENKTKFYYRSIAWLDSLGNYLELRVLSMKIKNKDKSEKVLDFIDMNMDEYKLTPENSWELQTSRPEMFSPDADSIIVEYEIKSENADKAASCAEDDPQVVIKLLNDESTTLSSVSAAELTISDASSEKSYRSAISLEGYSEYIVSSPLQVNVSILNMSPQKGVFASLGHVYDFRKAEVEEE